MTDYQDFFEDNTKTESNVSLKESIEKYTIHYKWFILSILLFLIFGFFYIRYTEPQFDTTTTILLKKDKGGVLSDLTLMPDMGFGSNNSFIDDEIQIIKSIPVVSSVVNELKLNVKYYNRTEITKRFVEVYKQKPFELMIKSNDSMSIENLIFYIEIQDQNNFVLIDESGKESNLKFGQSFNLDNHKMVLIPNLLMLSKYKSSYFKMEIKDFDEVVDVLRNDLIVEPISKTANSILIKLKSNLPEKSEDVLNKIVLHYINDAINDKNRIALKTAEFINNRIVVLNEDLTKLEKNVEEFKTENKLTDISSEAKQYILGQSEIEKKINETQIQLSLVKYMRDYLDNNPDELIPSNIGLQEPNIVLNIEKHNQLFSLKRNYLKVSTEFNPEVITLTNTLEDIRGVIVEGLKNQKSSLTITLNNFKKQDNIVNSKIGNIPRQEREYRDIFRQQQTKEALFLFLLQKREEATISAVSALPSAKVINHAYTAKKAVSPVKPMILLICIVIGFIIPFLFIYIKNVLDTKIKDSKQLEKLINIPILGNIARGENSERIILKKNDRTTVGESFRLLVANLEFLLNDTKKCKSILITSTISGEGKSFVSSNLAANLAFSGHKVVLIGLDLRVPKLDEYFKITSKFGVTHYIKDDQLVLDDIINKIDGIEHLDVINSGLILPNFIDIIKNNRLNDLITQLKEKYDYVIIDSAPVGLVSDTLLLNTVADLCLYVVRADYLDKRLLEVAEKLKKDKRFKDIILLLNDVDMNNFKYGYGNAYNYVDDQDKTASRFSKMLKNIKKK
ncbi:capsular exopolysaccharide synthesis family protein [Flavobacterium arsenatis]|uniref:non-specific protein-tyrosine kinase n=1 Tax=Flavobacterium arsenatis TaxID=1484332 RepID=A0ABU1TPG4_9FLAO|nr:polysaccharide biosynthesis tyrosine autokinase [Flavobacterium arsenatis]MDR6967869.1 capsular exopolysaccharide synthesis family protein [Flavobacterium arsenatis]